MMLASRRRQSFGLVVLILSLAASSQAHAATLSTEPTPTGISTGSGWVVWSKALSVRKYVLMGSALGKPAVILTSVSRQVPFDADVGTDKTKRVVVTYSRCRKDPPPGERLVTGLPNYASGSGCDLYMLDVLTRRERRLKAVSQSTASEYLPSSSGSRIGFVRRDEGRKGVAGRLPHLFIGSSTGKSREVPGGTRGVYVADPSLGTLAENGGPGPTQLDLNKADLAVLWSFVPADRALETYRCGDFDEELAAYPWVTEVRVTSTGVTKSRLVDRICMYGQPNGLKGVSAWGGERVVYARTFLGRCAVAAFISSTPGVDPVAAMPVPASGDRGVIAFSADKKTAAVVIDDRRAFQIVRIDEPLAFTESVGSTTPTCPT